MVDNEGEEIFADKVGVMLARDISALHPNSTFVVDVKSTGLFMTDPVLKQRGVVTDYWKTGHSYIKRRVNELHALGVKIWDGNVYAPYWTPKARFDGDAGRNYGQQWRDWVGPDGSHVDQLANVIGELRSNPSSRRHVVTAWNPAELDQTSLPACHAFFQFFAAPGQGPLGEGRLSVMMYQRSCDLFLGVPFNIAQYAVLLHLVARFAGLVPDEFIHVLADAHIYRDHQDAVREQLGREPFPAPRLALDPALRNLDDVVARYHEIVARARGGEKPGPLLDAVARLEQYQFHPPIEAKMAV